LARNDQYRSSGVGDSTLEGGRHTIPGNASSCAGSVGARTTDEHTGQTTAAARHSGQSVTGSFRHRAKYSALQFVHFFCTMTDDSKEETVNQAPISDVERTRILGRLILERIQVLTDARAWGQAAPDVAPVIYTPEIARELHVLEQLRDDWLHEGKRVEGVPKNLPPG
jgi:hypothetical protein